MHKDIYTAVFYLGNKIYRNEYINVVNDMVWLPCLRELSNHFCFYYVGVLIMNHKYILNEDYSRVFKYKRREELPMESLPVKRMGTLDKSVSS